MFKRPLKMVPLCIDCQQGEAAFSEYCENHHVMWLTPGCLWCRSGGDGAGVQDGGGDDDLPLLRHRAHDPLHPQVQYSTVQCSGVQYSAVQHSTVQYSTVQYST